MNESDREETIFASLLALPPGRRPAFLNEACAGEADLRRRLEELLRLHESAGGFLETPVAPGSGQTVRQVSPPSEKPGDKIGHYKLLEQIGEGGCGIVYMAEQEEPVRRRVALKIIKLGMDTKEVIARFEAERQALALMDHPNIAKVLDAGTTDTGRPYFVMELVRGIKVTDFCDDNKLSTGERLSLFIQICQAVQHAHQKGVIHRDLKPSNILITSLDGVPLPKVIDFGIAKATAGRLSDKTFFTAFQQFIGTPAYMSPEQAEMSALDIDTRSDIYSLGVLLYELLTGKTPFDQKDLLDAGLDAMRRTIREKEPPRPSTRLSTMAADALTITANHRHTDAPKLIHAVRGDLDWIVMKALEKDRARRYETANGLGSDIQRFLNNEPVTARPPSKLYEFQKTVRRHKFGFAAAASLFVVLAAGVVVSTVEAVRATRAEEREAEHRRQAEEARSRAEVNEQKARIEGNKSKRVAQLLKDMLAGVRPSVAAGRDTQILRDILKATSNRVARDMTNEPAVARDLLFTLAETYHQLGLYKEMESSVRQNLDFCQVGLSDQHPARLLALSQLADTLMHQGNLKEAESLIGEVLSKSASATNDPNVAASFLDLGSVLMESGKLEEAEEFYQKAFAMLKAIHGEDHPRLADSLHNLGVLRCEQGRFVEAEGMYLQALEILKSQLGSNHLQVAFSLSGLSEVLREQGRLKEAEAYCREALGIERRLLGSEHPQLAGSHYAMGTILAMQHKSVEAEPHIRETLRLAQKFFGEEHTTVSKASVALAIILKNQSKFTEAEPLFQRALAIDRKLLGNEHPETASALLNLAQLYRAQRRLTESETSQREALTLLRKTLGREHPMVATSLNSLANVLCDQGNLLEAEECCREGLEIRRKVFGNEHARVAESLNGLGCVLRDRGELIQAEDYHREALAIQRKIAGDTDPDVAEILHDLAKVLQMQGKAAEAEPLARESLAIFEHAEPDNWLTFSAKARLGCALTAQNKYAEAEPLLLSGYQGLKERETKIPVDGKASLREALQLLVRFYNETNQPEKSAEWKHKLEDFDRAEKPSSP